jgi:hypothetical protein
LTGKKNLFIVSNETTALSGNRKFPNNFTKNAVLPGFSLTNCKPCKPAEGWPAANQKFVLSGRSHPFSREPFPKPTGFGKGIPIKNQQPRRRQGYVVLIRWLHSGV